MTNKHVKTYKMLALAFVIVLSLGITAIAMAQASPGGEINAVQASYRLDNILAGNGFCSNNPLRSCTTNADCELGLILFPR